MEKEKLIKIIEELKEVRTKTMSKVPDSVLFDAGIRIYNSEQIESHRQGNKPFVRGEPCFSTPTTPNQISYLKNKLNYKGELPKTSQEASDLIDKLKGGSSKKNKQNFNKTYYG